MKYIVAVFSIVCCYSIGQAQQASSGAVFIPPKIPAEIENQLATFRPPVESASYPISKNSHSPRDTSVHHQESDLRGFTTVEIGNTYFDIQTNASICNSLFRDTSNGRMYAVWNFAPTIDPDFTSRGTGYNYFNGNFWLPDPSARIENVRTGWPNILVTLDNSQEYILCHNLQFDLLQFNKRTPPGTGTWTAELGNLPSPDAHGMWWPRIVRGQFAFGKYYLHAIALTLPVMQGGTKYHGVDGSLLYYRSSDNGATWDKQKILIPGLDSTSYARIRPDNYAIDAVQNEIAIVVGGFGNDLALFVSPDNGFSWQKTIIQKFPIPRFDDQITDIDSDGVADLVNTNDGSLSVLIDNSGTIHVFAGFNQIYNADSTDHQFSFQPSANGILYWNNIVGTQLHTITGALDMNGNGTLDVAGYGFFNAGFATHPSAGIDQNGNLFLAYSALDEKGKDADNKNVRHTYLMCTSNSGLTWSYPYDIVSDTSAEAIYACLARLNDDNLHLIYQKDFCAGVGATYNDPDPCNNGELSTILYVEVPASEVCSHTPVEEVADLNDVQVFPNPSSGKIHFSIQGQHASNGSVTILDLAGKIVFQQTSSLSSEQEIDLGFLPSGIYVAHFSSSQFNFTSKISLIK